MKLRLSIALIVLCLAGCATPQKTHPDDPDTFRQKHAKFPTP